MDLRSVSGDRGYLWRDLPTEISAEFNGLNALVVSDAELLELEISNYSWLGRERWWRQRELEDDRRLPVAVLTALREQRQIVVFKRRTESAAQLTPAQRMAKVRARRAAEGKCVSCERQREPGAARCDVHLRRMREIDQQYRERKRGMREKMPDLRTGLTHHFVITVKCHKCERRGELRPSCSRCAGQGVFDLDGYLRTGCYDDGRLGEIFLTLGKAGDEFAVYDSWCKAFSVALQYGAPALDLCRAFVGVRNKWNGPTVNKDVRMCKSIEDYIARYLLLKYGDKETQVVMREINGGDNGTAEVQP